MTGASHKVVRQGQQPRFLAQQTSPAGSQRRSDLPVPTPHSALWGGEVHQCVHLRSILQGGDSTRTLTLLCNVIEVESRLLVILLPLEFESHKGACGIREQCNVVAGNLMKDTECKGLAPCGRRPISATHIPLHTLPQLCRGYNGSEGRPSGRGQLK